MTESGWREHYPFASRVADVGGLRYHYVDEGTGPPVVLVHGNPTWSFYWRRLIIDLRSHHRAIAPDHIGMGWSDKPGTDRYPYTLARRVADFAEFMQGLALDEPITLVVHDWGGPIGLSWAVDHVDEVARLVITNTAGFGMPPGKKMPPALAFARSRPLGSALVLGANAFVRGAASLGVNESLAPDIRAGYLAPYSSAANRTAVLEFVRDIPLDRRHRSFDALDRLDRSIHRLVDLPMLICWGGRDFVFDDFILDEWVRRFPDADVHRFDDAGHFVLEDEADAVIQLVLEFLE